MTDTVEFREDTHQYFVNNVEYPSVSTVLSMFCDYSRVPRDVLERKRQIGRAVHHAIAIHETGGEIDPESIDEAWAGFFQGWLKLKVDLPGRVVASEQIVYSKKHRVAGRLDVNYLLNKDKALWQWDVKCVYTMSDATALQTAGYQTCWNEMHPDEKQITKRAGVQLKPDGTYSFFPYTKPEHRNDMGIFLNALNCWRWLMNHR